MIAADLQNVQVWVATPLDPASCERLARFVGNARLVQRQLVDPLAEEQQLPLVERLTPRTVVPPQQGRNRRLQFGRVPLAFDFQLPNGFFLDAGDQLVAFGEQLSPAARCVPGCAVRGN